MRALVRGLLVVATASAGCGGAPAAPPAATPDAQDINRSPTAPELVHLYKTHGDDPIPWEVTIRTDRTVALVYWGGHTGGTDKAIVLRAADAARAAALVEAVPWRRIRDHTVRPGGFGGNDNLARYMLRHGKLSTTYAEGDMPRPVGRLVRLLDRIIDGEVGTELASDSHHSSNGGILHDATK